MNRVRNTWIVGLIATGIIAASQQVPPLPTWDVVVQEQIQMYQFMSNVVKALSDNLSQVQTAFKRVAQTVKDQGLRTALQDGVAADQQSLSDLLSQVNESSRRMQDLVVAIKPGVGPSSEQQQKIMGALFEAQNDLLECTATAVILLTALSKKFTQLTPVVLADKEAWQTVAQFSIACSEAIVGLSSLYAGVQQYVTLSPFIAWPDNTPAAATGTKSAASRLLGKK